MTWRESNQSCELFKATKKTPTNSNIKILPKKKSSRNGTLDVYISDNILLNYLRYIQTDCNLKLTGDEFSTTGYALGMSKTEMSAKEKVKI